MKAKYMSRWFWDGVLSLVFGFLAINTSINGIQTWQRQRQFQCCSITAQAQVIDRWGVKGGSYPVQSYQYHVSYTFAAPQVVIKNDENIDWQAYQSAIPGKPVAIQYLSSNPTISRLVENTYQYPSVQMAALWWVTFLLTVWSFVSKLQYSRTPI
jgi:hypothetical protein